MEKQTEQKLFSCFPCRSRKLKCDRRKPACERCISGGESCVYPSTRKKPVITATRPRVKELEARMLDLEYRLKKANSENEQKNSSSPNGESPKSVDELMRTGRFEQLPAPELMEQLTTIYFARLHAESPMIHPARYWASLYLPPHMRPPMALQYAILARAADLSPLHRHLAEPFYRRARHYLEADEMTNDGQNFLTVRHVQAWVLLGFFEAQHLWFTRSSMSTSRAVRLVQILGLDSLDGKSAAGPTLMPPKDWTEMEERRRTFWMVFIIDRAASSTTSWPKLINWLQIQTILPVSEDAFEYSLEESSITLREALTYSNPKSSVFSFRVMAMHLFSECLDLNFGRSSEESGRESNFWKQQEEMDTWLSVALLSLPERLRCPPNLNYTSAILVNLQLHTASMCIHRAGAVRGTGRPHLEVMVQKTRARNLASAEQTFAIMAGVADLEALFHNAFVPFSCFMAATVFLEEVVMNQSKPSEEKLLALLNLMIAVSRTSSMTASLTVQLAVQLKKTGVDPEALEKTHHLQNEMRQDQPLLAQQDALEGTIIFCPLELQHKANMEASAAASSSPSAGSVPSIFDGTCAMAPQGVSGSVSSAGGEPGSVDQSSSSLGSSPWQM